MWFKIIVLILIFKTKMKNKITIQIPIEIAETLQGLIDGCIGTSGDDFFVKQMKQFLLNLRLLLQ